MKNIKSLFYNSKRKRLFFECEKLLTKQNNLVIMKKKKVSKKTKTKMHMLSIRKTYGF